MLFLIQVIYLNDITLLKNTKNFDIKQIFECGQAFRFNIAKDGGYEGVAFGKYLKVEQSGNDVTIHASKEDVDNIWHSYFDLDRDYESIISALSSDEVIRAASLYGSGIRILNQDTFECLISFIISQSNNIPRIKGIIERLCENFGDKINSLDGKTFFSFPTLKRLSDVSIDDLSVIRAGFRAKYIRDAVDKINSGDVDLCSLKNIDVSLGREQLKKIYGVGDKVANCVLLFGAGKADAFPVDTWIKKAISKFYEGRNFDPSDFGPYCGLAQQYLFYYARENKIKI